MVIPREYFCFQAFQVFLGLAYLVLISVAFDESVNDGSFDEYASPAS